MNTPHTVFNIAKLRAFTVFVIALALCEINLSPYAAAARRTEPSTTTTVQNLTPIPLTGTFQQITNAYGDEYIPRIDGDVATYLHDDYLGYLHLHLFNFATNTDQEIPSNGTPNFPSISGNNIAFSEATVDGPYAVVVDRASQTRTIVPGLGNWWTSLGGNVLAFENHPIPLDHSWWTEESEIALYDLTTRTVTSLTNDNLFDQSPDVSPTGDAIVWRKCQTVDSGCDIYSAVQTAPGVFNTTALTTTSDVVYWPSTNGEIAVYTAKRNGETDVYFQPVGGGVETRLSIPGDQYGPRTSGTLICFQSLVQHGNYPSYDIFVYDLATANLYQATDTLLSEYLSDIDVRNGVARIVYSTAGPQDFNLSAFTFQVPSSTTDQIEGLIALVESFGLPRGPENSLITKLEAALSALAAGDTATACSSVTSFINETRAQSDKKLTAEQANQLIDVANQIKTDLGCE